MMAKMRSSCIYFQLFCCILLGLFTRITWVLAATSSPEVEAEIKMKKPTVFIPILARNKAHTLPHFFGYLERLNYPKDRIHLWIRADHSVDNTIPMLKEWIQKVSHLYHTVDYAFEENPKVYALEKGPHDWPAARFNHLISLRDDALQEARNVWADYFYTMDVDNFVWDQDILATLMSENKTIIAPMLQSTTYYSNFWGGVTSKGFYKRTKEYVKIVKRNVTGCFKVPMVHSTYLINLNHDATDQLTYRPLRDFLQDLDDMLTFAHSARKAGKKSIMLYFIWDHRSISL
nr:procollagen galactosyltransferase 2-like [Lytechinus pictus]